MVDNVNPNSQFHPYQPMNDTPQTGMTGSGLSGILNRVGLNRGSVNMGNVRGWAQKNPSMVLGGLAALAIGMGLMRGRGRTR